MRYSSFILSSLSLLLVLALHSSCDKGNGGAKSGNVSNGNTAGVSIAYVYIDSFENNYNFLKVKREELTKRQLSMQQELERSAQQLQNSAVAYQQKVQARNISQVEAEATERKLAQMQQSLQLREQALKDQLLKETDEFNTQLHADLDNFLKDYNKDKKYDFILSHTSAGASPILLANPAFDITQDVIDGMNKLKKAPEDTTAKKKK